MIKNLVTVCMVLIFSACANKHDHIIQKVELATGYCHGECPFTATKIDGSLKIEFYGGKYADKKGFYSGTLSKQSWDDLTALLDGINYNQLDTVYRKTVDGQEMEIIITENGKVKHILAQSGSLPKRVADAFYKISKTYKKARLQLIKDSVHFATRVQYMPKNNGPKFPPSKEL